MNWSYAEISGTIGAFLGVANLLWTWSGRHLKVIVICDIPDDGESPGIEVSNLSHFDVTITEVGFLNKKGVPNAVGVLVRDVNERVLPKRIEARGYARFDISELPPGTLKKAYIKLSGGKFRYSNSLS